MGYEFKELKLLKQAFMHKSYVNELRNTGELLEHNEKLEFLGDAVLDLVVGEFLYEKFPQDTEGGLSKKRASIVNEDVLCDLARELKLFHFLQLCGR